MILRSWRCVVLLDEVEHREAEVSFRFDWKGASSRCWSKNEIGPLWMRNTEMGRWIFGAFPE